MLEYTLIDQKLHLLSQIIAKANRSFVPRKEDDSHTNLYYDAIANRILGRWILTSGKRIILGINIADQSFELHDDSMKQLFTTNFTGKTIELLEQEIEQVIQKEGLNTEGFRKDLHFEITEYPFAEAPIELLSARALKEWIKYRQQANIACMNLLGHLQAESEIRIWPHHFDTGIYAEVNPSLGIGFGLAMEDNMVGEPYYYISGYGLKNDLKYPNPPELNHGTWVVGEHWKGAYLKLSDLHNLTAQDSLAVISQFQQTTSRWYLEQAS